MNRQGILFHEIDPNSIDPTLPEGDLPLFAVSLPLFSHLLPLLRGSHSKARIGQGSLAGHQAVGPVQSLGR